MAAVHQLLSDARAALNARDPSAAERHLLEAISIDPENLDALMGLGTIAAQRGDPEKAVERFAQAAALMPDSPPARNSLAMALFQVGRYPEALTQLKASLAANPQDLAALSAISKVLEQVGEPQQALRHLDTALTIRPDEPGLLYSRANCLLSMNRFGEAKLDLTKAIQKAEKPGVITLLIDLELSLGDLRQAASLADRAINADPQTWVAHALKARALDAMGDVSGANACWGTAAGLAPNVAEVLLMRAKEEASLGRFEQSRAHFERCLRKDPAQGEAWFYLASMSPSPTLATRMAASPAGANAFVEYALAKVQDSLGDYGQAMVHYNRANAALLEAERPSFDLAAYARENDKRIRVFDREAIQTAKSWLAARGESATAAKPLSPSREVGERSDPGERDQRTRTANRKTQPIIVAGMMRSGTTLMEQILTCHSQVGGAGEQPFWTLHEPEFLNSDPFPFDRLQELSEEYDRVLRSCAPGFPRVVDKNPANCQCLGLIAAALPEAKIIHMRRNPVDVALSIWMTPMRTSARFVHDKANIVAAFREYERLTRHWQKVLPSEQYLEVRYEELTADPEPTLRRVLEFCSLEWEDACLHPESSPKAIRTPSFWQARQPLHATSQDRWRRYEPWLGEFRELLGDQP